MTETVGRMMPAVLTDDMVIAFAEAWYSKRRTIDDPDMEDAYAELLRAAPDPWRPIDTAPKDERETVLVSDGRAVGEAFWHDGSQCYGHRGKAGWFWEADRDRLLTASNAHVTHWMPLPAPPKP